VRLKSVLESNRLTDGYFSMLFLVMLLKQICGVSTWGFSELWSTTGGLLQRWSTQVRTEG
jgi:hypothetical protein